MILKVPRCTVDMLTLFACNKSQYVYIKPGFVIMMPLDNLLG